jgi:hypothetical protein
MFLETTPDTSGYMIAGYAIAFIVMGFYVFSLYLRNRNLHQDMEMLQEMDKPNVKMEAGPPIKPKKKPAKNVTKKGKKK